jgi:hypothetical protein
MKRLLALILMLGGVAVAQDATLYIVNDSKGVLSPRLPRPHAPSIAISLRSMISPGGAYAPPKAN